MKSQNLNFRVISTIASKDLLDAFKNRNILSLMFTVFMMVALYRFLPQFESSETPPRLVVYDRGESQWIARWDANPDYDLVTTTSQDEMESYVADRDFVALGLILPEDFDQRIEAGESITLDGYVIHWASEKSVETLHGFFEEALSTDIDKDIHLDLEGHTLYTQMDSAGYAFLTSLTVLLALSMGGMYIVPHLIFDEKQTRTLDSLMVSPASHLEILAAKVIAGGTIAVIAGLLTFGINAALVTHWWMALLVCLSGALFFVAVGLLVGTVLETRQQMVLWGFLLMFAMLIPALLVTLGSFLKAGILTVLNLTPPVAFINLVRATFTHPIPLPSLGINLALLLGWAAALYIIILVILHRKDRSNG